MPRKPSHLGSYCQPCPSGSSLTSSASIGGNGTAAPGIRLSLPDAPGRDHGDGSGESARQRPALDVGRCARRQERDRLHQIVRCERLPGARGRRGEGLRAAGARLAEGGAPARSERVARALRRQGGARGRGARLPLRARARRNHIRVGDRRLPRDHAAARGAAGARARPRLAPLPAERAGRLGERPTCDLARTARAELRAGLGVCHRLPRGGCGRRACGWHRGVHAPADPGRLLRHARPGRGGGASAAGLQAIRRHARRLRHRRGGGSARARGATIYAEVLGYGTSNDAYHLAAPEPEATGVALMMRWALERAGVTPERVGYINAHGTSTPLGDAAETKAIKDVFGDHAYDLAVSSTKSMMGHCFGAAGALEAQMAALAIHEGVLPPTINYEHPDPACDLDYVPNEAREAEVDVALSNAMGLGGHNACVLLGRVQ